MAQRGDIVVYDRYGKLIAVAAVRLKASIEGARALRDELLLHTGAPYILVITPQTLHIWPPVGEPLVEPTAKLLDPYLNQIGRDVTRVTSAGLEAVSQMWLSDLTADLPYAVPPNDREFLAAISDGDVKFEHAA